MSELQVAPDGSYVSGDIPFGYRLWSDRLIEVRAELDACVSMVTFVKQGKDYEAIAAAVREDHGVELSRAQFDALMASVFRRYGPI